jgi:hypothetical protein
MVDRVTGISSTAVNYSSVNVSGDGMMNIIIPSGAAITDDSANPVESINGAYEIVNMSLMYDNFQSPTQHLYALPAGQYSVTPGAGPNKAAFFNNDLSLSASTDDPAAVINGGFGSGGNGLGINSGSKNNFTITLIDSNANPLTLSGQADGDFNAEVSGKGLMYTGNAELPATQGKKSGSFTTDANKPVYVFFENDPPTGGNGGGTGVVNGTPAARPAEPADAAPETITQQSRTNPFSDVNTSDWFHDYVSYVYEKGLMNGTSDTLFSPNTALTRGMVVTVLYRNADSPDVSLLANPFSDVAEDVWYTNAVKWASENGIVTGYGSGQFGPNDAITREQLALIIYNNAKLLGWGPQGAWAIPLNFVDKENISDWAIEAAMYCSMKGIISGKPGEIFDSRGEATRAEFAAVLKRFLEVLQEI